MRQCLICNTKIVPVHRKEIPPGARRHRGRGLCNRCWRREMKAGRLHEWPSTNAACTDGTCDWCQEVRWLAESGSSPYEWADRMGTTVTALSRRLYRHGLLRLAKQVERIRAERRRQLRRAA